jgi:acyl dehydratase
VYLSDVVRLGGRVAGKEIDQQGRHTVTLQTWARNQRGDVVMAVTALVALLRRGDAGGAGRQLRTSEAANG